MISARAALAVATSSMAIFPGCTTKRPGTKPAATAGVRFPAAKPSVRVPFELLANSPYVQVKVNGKGPFLFAIDTGSIDSPLCAETLAELGLPAGTEGDIELTFEGDLQITTPRSKTLSLAGLWPLLGRRFYGIIGYDVLKHFVVEFDYERRMVTFSSPTSDPVDHQAMPATMMMGYDPQVPGELDVPGVGPVRAAFTIDTGAGGTVVTTPLVQKYALTEKIIQKVPSPGQGVGSMQFNDVVGRIGSIRIGGLVLDKPLVALSLDTDGPLAMEELGVNVGGNLLQRFTVIVDYPRRQLALLPNARFHDPFASDASGLVLQASGGDWKTITVRGVVTGSPADEAGVKEGDVISDIDGQPTSHYALWQIQDLFKEAGVERTVRIVRPDNSTTTVRFKLRALA